MGYTLPVRALLKGQANVFHPMRPDGKLPVNFVFSFRQGPLERSALGVGEFVAERR